MYVLKGVLDHLGKAVFIKLQKTPATLLYFGFIPDISLGSIVLHLWQNNQISKHPAACCECDP